MATKETEVRWGIIGVGDVCEIKSGPALQRIPNSKLVAVMRRNAEKAKDYAKRHNVPKWYDNADALINDPEVNAVYIATPPDSHEAYTLKVAKAGKPVYVEKPMARSYKECVSMVEACKKADVPLFVAFYRRRLPNILKVKKIIDKGIIGEIRFVTIKIKQSLLPQVNADNWRVIPEIAGGGYFYDLASHQFDALDFLLGPISEAHGYAVNQANLYPAEDLTVGTYKFENGILGHGVWSFNTSKISEEEVTTIVGSKGQVSFNFFGDHTVKLKVADTPTKEFNFDFPKHIQEPLIQTVVEELLGKGKCPSTGVSGARANWVLEQICQRD